MGKYVTAYEDAWNVVHAGVSTLALQVACGKNLFMGAAHPIGDVNCPDCLRIMAEGEPEEGAMPEVERVCLLLEALGLADVEALDTDETCSGGIEVMVGPNELSVWAKILELIPPDRLPVVRRKL